MLRNFGLSTGQDSSGTLKLFAFSALAAMLVACGPADSDDDQLGERCLVPQALPAKIDSAMTLASGNCYLASADVVVSESGHLTIDPDVAVLFAANTGLLVEGSGKLTAAGNADERIVLTGTERLPGHWKGVAFHGTNSTDNVLDYVTIEYGGGQAHPRSGAANLAIDGRTGRVRVAVSNTILRHSGAAGLWADSDNDNENITISEFSNNELTENQGFAASVRPNVAGFLKASSRYSGNVKDYVYVHVAKDVQTEQTWEALDVPFLVKADFAVKGDGHLTLAPGARLVFEENAGIAVWDSARMTAAGTAEAPILLTGAEKIRGFWKGIAFHGTNSTDNVLDHVTIEYGGGESHSRVGAANLAVDDRTGQVRIKVSNTTLRESGAFGFWADGDNNNLNIHVTGFENNVLTANTSGPAAVRPTVSGIFSATGSYSGNDVDYVFVRTNKPMATSQTWAALDVPYRVAGELTVEGDTLLTIEAGARVVFEADRGLAVWESARLKVSGTNAEPVVFTGLESTPGYWMGIAYHGTNSTDNVLEHAHIEFGGGVAHYRVERAGLAIDNRTGPARVRLSAVHISNSASHGLFIESGWSNTVTIDGCDVTFADNAGNDLEPTDAQCPR